MLKKIQITLTYLAQIAPLFSWAFKIRVLYILAVYI